MVIKTFDIASVLRVDLDRLFDFVIWTVQNIHILGRVGLRFEDAGNLYK